MKKYALMAILALSQTVMHADDTKFNKEAHDKYVREEIKWGAATAVSIPSTKLAWNAHLRFDDYIWDKRYAYSQEKARRSVDYKQNPNFKQYCKNTGWILRNNVQHAARLITFVPTTALGIAIPAAVSIASPIIMYAKHAQYHERYTDKKRA